MSGREFSRRDFLKSSALVGGSMLIQPLTRRRTFLLQSVQKRVYIAPDDHTDYFWSAGEAAYRDAFIHMIDYYLDLADATQNNPPEYQSRWNCDGSFWLWTYEKNKSEADYRRLINRIKDGHISVPMNALVLCLGGAPAEAVLRGMYYAGKIERREDLRFRLAISMENQTLPLGLASLWAGAGARFSWKGICGCDSAVLAAGDREHEIYWWQGLDGSRILMKWNSMLQGNQYPGGYAEARYPDAVVDFVDGDAAFAEKYPYPIIGCFGKGWDDVETMTDEFVTIARNKTNAARQVIVSNEEDFFDDFESNYGSELPALSVSFGNEWDLYCVALAETSANIKRSLEKLRGAEALAAIARSQDPSFMDGRQEARDQAWMDFGLYWEHNFGMVGTSEGALRERIAWQKRLEGEIASYVDALARDGISTLGNMIAKDADSVCFYVFNPLSWTRSDYADFPYEDESALHVIDRATGADAPSQRVMVGGRKYLRVLASQVPSLGYKVFEIRNGVGQRFEDAAVVQGNVLESPLYQVTLAENGSILSWKDKTRQNREFVKSINGLAANDLGPGAGSIQVENAGPVTVTLVTDSSSPLTHTTRVTLIRDSMRLEIQNEINQNFDATQKWSFGFDLNNPNVWHEEVGAILNAKLTTDGGHYSPRDFNSRYDWLTLNHFVDMSDGAQGVTLSNADCYFMRLGNSSVSEMDVRTPQISVLAGGRVVGSGGGIPDQGGEKKFLQRFALGAHGAYDPALAMRFALEHQNPCMVGEVKGGGRFPSDLHSSLEVDNPNVLVWAFKPADDGADSGFIVRVWNVSQSRQDFVLRLGGGIRQALNLTHVETPLGNASVRDNALVDSLSAQQMKTYAVFAEGLESSSIIPAAPAATTTPGTSVAATATTVIESAASTPRVTPTATSVAGPVPEGKGCLLGLLDLLLSMFK